MQKTELTLLVIDDQPDNLITLRALIRESFPSARILTATSCAQGLELADAEDPDTILLDIKMCDVDGFEICRRLKNNCLIADIPVVFIALCYDIMENKIKSIEVGSEGFLCRPINGAELFTLIGAMAKLRAANRFRREQARRLSDLVIERTRELAQARDAALALVDELRRENDARRASETSLEQALRALRESERTHRALISELPDVVIRFDRDGRHLFVSENVFRAYGLHATELVGKTGRELGFSASLCQRTEELIARVCDLAAPLETEFAFEGPGGASIFNWRLTPTLDAEGDVQSVLCIGRDITAHRTLERDYRTLFREMLNGFALHDLICDQDGRPVDYRFLAVNPAFEQMTGLDASTILGKTALEVLPGLEPGWLEAYGAVVTTGQPAHFVRRADQLRKTFEVTAFRPAPGQFACNFLDITERVNAEDRLRSSQEFLTNIVGAIADPVFVKDDQFRFTLVNDALCEALGRPAEELLGMTGADFLAVDEMKHFLAVDRAVLESGEPLVSEDQITGADGVTRTVITKKVRYVDPEGARSIVGVSRDVTDFKRMQAQIARSDRLASVGMLAAGVAHEINNPLAYVLYNLESLTEELPRLVEVLGQCSKTITGSLGVEAWSALVGSNEELFSADGLEDIIARFRDALSGTHRIKAVARGLGTFSRVEDTALAPVDVIQIIEVAINMAFNEIKYKSRLIREYNDVSLVLASDGRLSQVFLNLLINAAQAIRDGDFDQNEIRVRTFEDSGEVCVAVADTGTGIPESHLARLFEPFFTTKARGVGTGLGLSISRDIVEGYGGRIEVTSELGVGTRFVVRLPAIPVEPAPDEAPFDEQDAGGDVHGRVLVVDDDAGIRAALGRILNLHEVVVAQSGDEARTLLKVDQAFDLILCDVMMPVVSGVDLHAWLTTAHPELADRVVFVTGGAFTAETQEYLSHHANLQVEKPFAPAAIVAIADELTRHSPRRSTGQE